MKFPIFPLNGAILFPNTSLPLNIFEERYIEMVDYALGHKRLIGMIQSKPNGDLFNIGCLGKIISYNEAIDGRYLISLEGIKCFKINHELKQEYKFRIVDADIINSISSNEDLDRSYRKKILDLFAKYTKKNHIKLNIKELEGIKFEQLIKYITMISPFEDNEKQMCLETLDVLDFSKKLISILDIYTKDLIEKNTIN